jgi:hypothetical protein
MSSFGRINFASPPQLKIQRPTSARLENFSRHLSHCLSIRATVVFHGLHKREKKLHMGGMMAGPFIHQAR